jgi:VanZ family protein
MGGRRLPWLTGLVTAVILGALFLPAAAVPSVGIDHVDVAVHVALFGAWMGAAAAEFPRTPLWRLATVAALLAVGTELLQHFSPGRTFSWLDIASDTVGIMACLVVAALLRRRAGRRAEVG